MSSMVEYARKSDGNAQYHTLGLDVAGSLDKTGAVGAVLASSDMSGKGFDYLYDGNGNVIANCDAGNVISKLSYSPFGKQLSGKKLPFTFSSKAADSSGMSYYGYRFYSANLGRWISKDPLNDLGSMLMIKTPAIKNYARKAQSTRWVINQKLNSSSWYRNLSNQYTKQQRQFVKNSDYLIANNDLIQKYDILGLASPGGTCGGENVSPVSSPGVSVTCLTVCGYIGTQTCDLVLECMAVRSPDPPGLITGWFWQIKSYSNCTTCVAN